MSSFEQCLDTEKPGVDIVKALVESKGYTCVLTSCGRSKNQTQKTLQATVGDLLVQNSEGYFVLSIEVKTERRETGNLYVETWSNFGKKEGWLFSSQASYLACYFLDTGLVIVIDFHPFRDWVIEHAYTFRESPQLKHKQLNQTRGLLVPIKDVPEHLIRFQETMMEGV